MVDMGLSAHEWVLRIITKGADLDQIFMRVLRDLTNVSIFTKLVSLSCFQVSLFLRIAVIRSNPTVLRITE